MGMYTTLHLRATLKPDTIERDYREVIGSYR